jgi:hypothetical protein
MAEARRKGDEQLYSKLGGSLGEAYLDMILDGPGTLSNKEKQSLRDSLQSSISELLDVLEKAH